MRWKPDLNLTTNARVFTAVYVGALVMGPPAGSWAILGFMRSYWGSMVMASLAAVPLGGFVAGVIGGKDHGLRAALGALFLSKSMSAAGMLFYGAVWNRLAESVASLIALALLVGGLIGLAAWGGEVVWERYGLADRLQTWRHWRKAGLFFVLLFTYSLTLGGYVAVRRIGYSHLKSYPVGVYIAVADMPLAAEPANPTHYMDPTGLLEVGYYCIRH